MMTRATAAREYGGNELARDDEEDGANEGGGLYKVEEIVLV